MCIPKVSAAGGGGAIRGFLSNGGASVGPRLAGRSTKGHMLMS